MVEVEYMHICDFAFPAQGGKPCFVGVFDNITVTTLPAVHPVMFVAVQFRGKPHEVIPFTIELARPNGAVIVHVDGTTYGNSEGVAFVAAQLITVQFSEHGQYAVRVLSNGRMLMSQFLRIQRPQSQQPSPPRTH